MIFECKKYYKTLFFIDKSEIISKSPIIFQKVLQKGMECAIIQGATQFYILAMVKYTFLLHGKSACSIFVYSNRCRKNCVAAIGALHFSVRSFGCALFLFGKGAKDWQKLWEPLKHPKSGAFLSQQSANGVGKTKSPVRNRIRKEVLGISQRMLYVQN